MPSNNHIMGILYWHRIPITYNWTNSLKFTQTNMLYKTRDIQQFILDQPVNDLLDYVTLGFFPSWSAAVCFFKFSEMLVSACLPFRGLLQLGWWNVVLKRFEWMVLTVLLYLYDCSLLKWLFPATLFLSENPSLNYNSAFRGTFRCIKMSIVPDSDSI